MRLRALAWALVGALPAFSAFGAVRPHSLEQYIADTIGWPTAITHGKYQARYEWAFMDSAAGDTCEPTYPFDSFLATEGVTDCYDLAVPSWADVSCTGASAQHPTLSNVYIMRPSSPNWSAANNASYRWVLFCPGSYANSSLITITADGIGFDAGQMRIYGCLDSDGSWDPMRYAVTRTATSDECHIEAILLNDARYVWFVGFYFESTSKARTHPAFEIRAPAADTKMFSGLHNFDAYAGGQTAIDTGYRTTRVIEFDRGLFSYAQNGRIVDCVARRSSDDKPIAAAQQGTSFSRAINLEVHNCAYILSGENNDAASWLAEGQVWENVWQSMDGARHMDEIDPRYWNAAYLDSEKIPYGYQGGGQPPSYVKSTAVSAADLNDAFECAADKFSDACPFICSESGGIFFKKGAMAANEPHRVRRVFTQGGRVSRRDNDNPIEDESSPPTNDFSRCGGSSGTQGHTGIQGGQYNNCGVQYDLIFTDSPGFAVHQMFSSSYTNTCVGVDVTNSAAVITYESWMNNEFLDDWWVGIFNLEDGSSIAGEPNQYTTWGTTYAAQGFENAPVGVYANREWLQSRSGVTVNMDCSVVIDVENQVEGALINVEDQGRYGNAGRISGAIGSILPSNTLADTYDTADLQTFTHITRPFSAIANGGPVTTQSWPNLIPAPDSPIVGACTVAAP